MKKRRSLFDDDWFFPDLSDMESMFDDIFKEMKKGRFGEEGNKPMVYGFSMRMGPDGKPHFEQFGNVNVPQGKIKDEREPMVDVINNAKDVTVIAELPGVERNQVKLSVADKRLLTIKVDEPQRKYFKQVRMPVDVDERQATAKLKNGILEVVLKKLKPSEKDERGSTIKVEGD